MMEKHATIVVKSVAGDTMALLVKCVHIEAVMLEVASLFIVAISTCPSTTGRWTTGTNGAVDSNVWT